MANVSLVKAMTVALTVKAPAGLMSPDSRGGWYPLVHEPFTGAWQMNVTQNIVDLLSHPTVFACITLIAGDIAKMRLELVREDEEDVWVREDVPAFSPVLRKPNHFQTPFQFRESWMLSKLIHGNTYVLKQRDARGVVIALYVLDPQRVKPLIAPDGSVFYELKRDELALQPDDLVIVPAREIIHDRFNTFFHPLVGISPLYACGIAAMLGLKIQNNSTLFFANGSQPGGILTASGPLKDDAAKKLKEQWEASFGGQNRGRTAVLGYDLKYTPMTESAEKSQLTEQWDKAAEAIATAFHVPFYLVGGPMPPYNNIQALNVQYYTQCLQPLTTQFEDVLDFGLGLAPDKINGVRLGTQFNINDLLYMDSLTLMQVIKEGVGAGVYSPDEGRAKVNLRSTPGGNTPYMQNQMWPLQQLASRPTPSEPAPPAPEMPTVDESDGVNEAALLMMARKDLNLEQAA